MKASLVSILIVLGLSLVTFSYAEQRPKVGGFEQIPPDEMGVRSSNAPRTRLDMEGAWD